MARRLDYYAQSPDMVKKFMDFSQALRQSSIDTTLRHLVDIRASQINGCGFCLDMHVKQAKIAGERELRLHHIAIWRDSSLFDDRERAVLEWTETLTKLPEHGISDDIYNRVREQFSEKELTDLTLAIIAINGWNRVSIGFKNEPGSMDAAYGLTKAGLH